MERGTHTILHADLSPQQTTWTWEVWRDAEKQWTGEVDWALRSISKSDRAYFSADVNPQTLPPVPGIHREHSRLRAVLAERLRRLHDIVSRLEGAISVAHVPLLVPAIGPPSMISGGVEPVRTLSADAHAAKSPIEVGYEVHDPAQTGDPFCAFSIRNDSSAPLIRLKAEWARFDPSPRHLWHPPLPLLLINEAIGESAAPQLEVDLAPGAFLSFVLVSLHTFTNLQSNAAEHTLWLYFAAKDRHFPIGPGPFICDILITAHNMQPRPERLRIAVEDGRLAVRSLTAPEG